jgi:hypothetical protein
MLFLISMLCAASFISIIGFRAASADGAGNPKTCEGTYLIEFANGSTGLWTMSDDGTFQGADSAEDFFTFGHSQGAWTAVAKGVTKLVALNFTEDAAAAPTTMARVDATLTFGGACSEVDVDYDVRIYDVAGGQDPLVPGGGFLAEQGARATGRLVTAN